MRSCHTQSPTPRCCSSRWCPAGIALLRARTCAVMHLACLMLVHRPTHNTQHTTPSRSSDGERIRQCVARRQVATTVFRESCRGKLVPPPPQGTLLLQHLYQVAVRYQMPVSSAASLYSSALLPSLISRFHAIRLCAHIAIRPRDCACVLI